MVPPRPLLLDPDLPRTQPPHVASASGIDAVAHTVETAATKKRSDVSLAFTKAAWDRLDAAFDRAMAHPDDDEARAKMPLGAHLAGAAIEQSMLGAAHACANPLTARLGVTHGVAVGMLLPFVVRFNARKGDNPYGTLDADAERLARRLEAMRDAARLPRCLRDLPVPEEILPELSEEAAKQWTADFNPRPVAAPELAPVSPL